MAQPQTDSVSMKDVMAMLEGMNKNMLASVAEVVAEMKKPYVDHEKIAREKREASKTKRDMEQQRILEEQAQKLCSHKFKKTGVWAISLVHNFPDRQTRGRCNLCRANIHPEYWEIAYDANDPAGKPFRIAAHPEYHVVKELEAESAYQLA